MMEEFEVIDVKNRVRRVPFEWFSTFSDPTYGFCVKIDVSDVVSFSKETHSSFFANFYYAVMRAINELPQFRLRIRDEQVVLYERIDPDFTVKTDDGCFNNAGFEYSQNYKEFYERCRKTVEENNKTVIYKDYNTPKLNLVYTSCLTSIDIMSMIHPVKNGDPVGNSVPKIFWDKYINENGRYYLNLNISVSHALVDGEQLSEGFVLIRKYCKDFKNTIKQ